jgi:hypothetical protein
VRWVGEASYWYQSLRDGVEALWVRHAEKVSGRCLVYDDLSSRGEKRDFAKAIVFEGSRNCSRGEQHRSEQDGG